MSRLPQRTSAKWNALFRYSCAALSCEYGCLQAMAGSSVAFRSDWLASNFFSKFSKMAVILLMLTGLSR